MPVSTQLSSFEMAGVHPSGLGLSVPIRGAHDVGDPTLGYETHQQQN